MQPLRLGRPAARAGGGRRDVSRGPVVRRRSRATVAAVGFVVLSAMAGRFAWATDVAYLYWVDLEVAAQRVPEGAKARRTLTIRHQALQREIDAREARLTHRRAKMSDAEYSAALDAHRAYVDRERKRLEEMQDRLLSPILDRLRARMGEVTDKRAARSVVAMQDGLLIGPPAECERTSWLVKAYRDPKTEFSDRIGTCAVEQVLIIDVDRVMAALPEAAAATARLQAFVEARQTELDRRRRQQRVIADKARETGDPRWREELAFFSADLDRRYAQYRAALRDREAEEEDRLYGEVTERLRRAVPAGRATWLAEARVPASIAQCDGTQWAIRALRASTKERPPTCAG